MTARNVHDSGLLLNDTINATIGTVDAQGAGTGTGYAAFRMANRNGRIGGSYPTNIRVGNVIASGGGRGIFCVWREWRRRHRPDHAQQHRQQRDPDRELLQRQHRRGLGNCHRWRRGRIAARTEFPISSNITLQNLTVSNTNIRQSPCGGASNVIRNVTRNNSTLTWC